MKKPTLKYNMIIKNNDSYDLWSTDTCCDCEKFQLKCCQCNLNLPVCDNENPKKHSIVAVVKIMDFIFTFHFGEELLFNKKMINDQRNFTFTLFLDEKNEQKTLNLSEVKKAIKNYLKLITIIK